MFPDGLWAWFGENPEASSTFDEAMRGKSFAQVAGVVACYDFSKFARVADIGGGRGHLLEAIVERWPNTHGMLFEQPHVIEQARSVASDKLSLVAGDFFADRLPESECYVLMEVIHDWNDESALKILGAVRDSAPRGATLLLIEQLMPDSPEPNWVQMLDIHMLALFGARQRSSDEYGDLLRKAGFEPTNVIETLGGAAIIEAQKE
jgi:trans-aconitate methyltransferase